MSIRNTNALIERLHHGSRDFIRRYAKPVEFARGDFLARKGEPIASVIFPTSGLVSVVIGLADGSTPEVGLVGRQGAVGGAALFGKSDHSNDLVATTELTAWAIQADEVISGREDLGFVRKLMFRNEQFLLVQAQQRVGCNSRHSTQQRLASWLLQAFEALGQTELWVTQDQIGQLLGVQRASVSVAASDLQSSDLIQYRRGRVRIADRTGLEQRACGCHAAIRTHREHLLHDLSEGGLPVLTPGSDDPGRQEAVPEDTIEVGQHSTALNPSGEDLSQQ